MSLPVISPELAADKDRWLKEKLQACSKMAQHEGYAQYGSDSPIVRQFVEYTSQVATHVQHIDTFAVIKSVDALYDAWKDGNVVMFCGNGGSGASCSHIVNDLLASVRREFGIGLKAVCLNDCTATVTALANDSGWGRVFAPQVATWAEEGAILVLLSGSGNSANVINAAESARGRNVKVIALTGFDGGTLRTMADISIHVPTDSMQQAEDVHMVILHMLFLGLMERIKAGAK